MSGLVNEFLSDDTQVRNDKLRVKEFTPELIEPNKFNQDRALKDIPGLAMNIEACGLLQPIVVRKIKGRYVMVAGHRRTAAIKQLFAEGKSINYLGVEFYDSIPTLVLDIPESVPEGSTEERIMLLGANAQLELTKDQKIQRTKEVEEVWFALVKENKKPEGKKRDWISAITGYSERAVQNYLGEDDSQADDSTPSQVKAKSLGFTSAGKALNIINKVSPEQLVPEDIETLKKLKKAVNNLLKSVEA